MFKLISATPSPFARKVRIALAEKGLPFELLTEVPWHASTATPRHNPLEKLPVLILEDGGSVYESSYILQWLELRHPQPALLPEDIDGKLAARRLEVLCDGVCDARRAFFRISRSSVTTRNSRRNRRSSSRSSLVRPWATLTLREASGTYTTGPS